MDLLKNQLTICYDLTTLHRTLKIIIICLSSLVLVSIVDGIMFNCNYAIRTQWNVNDIYSCEAQVLFLGHECNLIEVSRNHMAGMNNSDVKLLAISSQLDVTFYPRNVYQFFPNLEAIYIYDTAIEEMTEEDLQGMQSLKQFQLVQANVVAIRNDWFIGAPNLVSIQIHSQPLQHIAPRVFDHLRLNELDKLIYIFKLL